MASLSARVDAWTDDASVEGDAYTVEFLLADIGAIPGRPTRTPSVRLFSKGTG